MAKKIKVGFDFDGVIAYNPFRIARPVMAYVKRNIFGVKKLKFWYPQKKWQQIFWIILHESSVFPAKGVHMLKKLVEDDIVEAHLVTARYSFLDDHLYRWLDRHKLRKYFKTINVNKNNEQPHLFKQRLVDQYKFDMFVEDNLDIVKHLQGKTDTKIYWIYNIFDRDFPHPHKHPYLEQVLKDILNRSEIKAQRSKPSSKTKN